MYKLTDVKIIRKGWIQNAGIPKSKLGWTLSDCELGDSKTIKNLQRWIESAKTGNIILASGKASCGRGALIYGEPGRGKTTMAVAALQDMMLTFPLEAFAPAPGKILVRPCYFSTFNEILALKGTLMDGAENDEKMLYEGMLGTAPDDSYNIRVLIIDDIGKEHSSDSGWQSNILHDVLRNRFNKGLPTIVTTNINRDHWEVNYGSATASFAKEAFVYFPLSASQADLRK